MRPIEVRIDISGFKRFDKKMNEAIINGLKKGGLAVERRMKIYSPVDTGLMRRSMKTGNVVKTMDGYSIDIGPSVVYAIPLEYSSYKPRKTGRIPFMRPALKDSINQIKSILFNELKRVLR